MSGIKLTAFLLVGLLLACILPTIAHAGGYLWLSGEFAPPTSIYRYNIAAGSIDLTVQPMFGGNPLDPGTDVYNNLAIDGTTLYIGTDDNELFAKADPLTGAVSSAGSYVPAQGGSYEDGSYNAGTGTLFRTSYSPPRLIETNTNGGVLTNRAVNNISFLDGLEWVGGTLYATSLDQGRFGTVTIIDAATALFTDIPLSGIPAGELYGGLAYDQQDGRLYMATTNGSRALLWRVQPILATATLVQDLTANAGYPAGFVLPDAMGWIAIPEPAGLSLAVSGLLALAAGATWPRRR
jgi:hypothetical protein